jgi:hypothetical protein
MSTTSTKTSSSGSNEKSLVFGSSPSAGSSESAPGQYNLNFDMTKDPAASTPTGDTVPTSLVNEVDLLMENPVPSQDPSANMDMIDTDPSNKVKSNWFSNPLVLSALLIGLILLVTLMVYLGGISGTSQDPAMDSQNNSIGQLIMKTLFVSIVVLLVLYIIQYMLFYYFGFNITSTMNNLLSSSGESSIDVNIDQSTKPEPDTPIQEPAPVDPTPVDGPEVFNVSDNVYNYEDAKLICKAYDAELATYSQIEKSYNAGGEWCNYGWSANQLALFPTQQSTYDGLQQIPGHKNDCGRPGINGGYIANPNVRFGVNCYGIKPKMTPEEEAALANATPYPQTKKDTEMEQKVNQWKDKLDSIMVSPFNYNQWSE